MEIGKLPPQEIEIEKSILGALLIKSDAIIEVMDFIKVEHFYKLEHQIIYSAIFSLGARFYPIDIITVANELRKTDDIEKVGDVVYLAELTESLATAAHLEFHCKILYETYMKREMITIGYEMQRMSYDPMNDISEVIDYAQKKILDTTVDDVKSEPSHCSVIYEAVADDIEHKQINPDSVGIPSGFRDLRWHNSDLIIMAARSSMGKTWIGAVKFAFEAAITNVPTLIFSLEMSKQQIMHRFISLHSGIDSNDIRDGNKSLDWQKLEESGRFFSKLPLYIDDNSGLSVFQLASKARKMKSKHDIGLIIVDYLQLVSGLTKNTNTKDQEIGVVSRTLKALAKDLNIPVIALAQINRGVEQRQDKRPMMSDLRDSGNIEQDADMVGMLYRPYYYTQNTDDAGTGEIIIRKYRHGKLQTLNFYHTYNWSKIQSSPITDSIEEFKKYEKHDDIKNDEAGFLQSWDNKKDTPF